MNTKDPRQTSFAKTALLWIGVIAAVYIALRIASQFLGAAISDSPSLAPPQIHINPQPSLFYAVRVSPIDLDAELIPESSTVEVTHTIQRDKSGYASCIPRKLETGTDYPFYPVKEAPKVQVSVRGEVTFAVTYDYIMSEDFYGKGKCRYGVSSADLMLRNGRSGFRAALTGRDFRDFGEGDKTKVLFCVPGEELTGGFKEGQCKTNLDNLTAEFIRKYRPMFMVEAELR